MMMVSMKMLCSKIHSICKDGMWESRMYQLFINNDLFFFVELTVDGKHMYVCRESTYAHYTQNHSQDFSVSFSARLSR